MPVSRFRPDGAVCVIRLARAVTGMAHREKCIRWGGRPLTHPQILRDHRSVLPAVEPLARLVPDPLTKQPPLGGQPAALCVSRTTGLPQGSPAVTIPDNTPKKSVAIGGQLEEAQ